MGNRDRGNRVAVLGMDQGMGGVGGGVGCLADYSGNDVYTAEPSSKVVNRGDSSLTPSSILVSHFLLQSLVLKSPLKGLAICGNCSAWAPCFSGGWFVDERNAVIYFT